MGAGRSPVRILIVPRPRAEVAARVEDRVARTTIRTFRRVAPRSAQGVLVRAAREARDPGWSLMAAAQAVVGQVDGDLAPARGARVYLLASPPDRWTLSDARTLATIEVAIATLEGERRPSPVQRAR